ncbi:MAG: hypothetical protein L0Y67_06190 [Gammaproteobacteria bacterium]|nr:hypothetical protein [Gammaproteobacteria bacterium]MCI0591176.1 hypothetical protein [Gammaproteobacteria bacterium]
MGRETDRIGFVVERDGIEGAREWVKCTLQIYRSAIDNPKSHASKPEYRAQFEDAIRELEAWLLGSDVGEKRRR